MKALHDRAISAGCLVTFVAFVGAITWTYVDGWTHSIWIAVTVGAAWLLGTHSRNRTQRAIQALMDASFVSRGVEAPACSLSGGYGYPGYTLSFTSAEAEQKARQSGALAAFIDTIQELHRDDGSKSRPFDAKMAVHTTWPGKGC